MPAQRCVLCKQFEDPYEALNDLITKQGMQTVIKYLYNFRKELREKRARADEQARLRRIEELTKAVEDGKIAQVLLDKMNKG